MFNKVLITDPVNDGRRRRSVLVASALHMLALGSAIAGSMLAIHAVQDPMQADFELNLFAVPKPPDIDPPKPKAKFEIAQKQREPEPQPEPPKPKVEEAKRIEFKPELPEIEVPKNIERQRSLEIAAQKMHTLGGSLDAPEPAVVTTARNAVRPAAGIAAGSYHGGGGSPLAATLDAPEVKVPGGGRGGPGLPARAPGIQVGDGGGGGSIVAYASASPATMGDFTVPRPGGPGRPGGKPGGMAPGLITVAGDGVGGGAGSGGRGIKYGGPADAPGGEIGSFGVGGRPGGRGAGNARIEGVRSALSNKYGLPLVSVNDLGQRSTEAARWNMLLPQISDLLRIALRGRGTGSGGDVLSVESDGTNLVIRYRDGIVHVLVPTEDGLAALFVARGAGARPVVSKVQEAESALGALSRLTRGVS